MWTCFQLPCCLVCLFLTVLSFVIVPFQSLEFSLRHGTALVAFSGDRCLTLFDHPLVDKLHTTYYEPRVSIFNTVGKRRSRIILDSEAQRGTDMAANG